MQDIAEMQNTLSLHLSAQSETIQQIHKDTIDSSISIEKGNQYLASAERIFGGPRLWVLIFFLLASFVILFLDYYYS
jgi:t-SNARE complex subunit (syntaxin)